MLNIKDGKPTQYQLPNALREAMLQANAIKGLMVLEGLYMLSFKANIWLTAKEIYRVCRDNFGMSYQLVYQGLLKTQIFQRRKADGVAHRRGPRPYLYRIPHPDELIAEFDVGYKYSPHDELQKADLKSVCTYRRALHRQMFIRKWLESNEKRQEKI
jgi:hypothetical protein